jgi:hypothetical protein
MSNIEISLITEMDSLSNQELLNILGHKNEYPEKQYEAAVLVAFRRKLFSEKQIKNYLSALSFNSIRLIYSYADVKNGLNNFSMGFTLFFVSFIIASAFNWNFDDPKVGNTLIGIISLVCLFFNFNLLSYDRREEFIPNTFSGFTTWLAEPFIYRNHFRMVKNFRLNFRRGFINLVIVIPFVAFNYTNTGYSGSTHTNRINSRNTYSSNSTNPLQETNRLKREIESKTDSVKIFISLINIGEGDRFFEAKDYKGSLYSYKNALLYNDSDTTIYMGIGNCFWQLNQKDSARYYWEKAGLLGSSLAEKKLKRLK